MSVPVVVTVHGNQQCEAEATVFWENAFAEKVRHLFRLFRNLKQFETLYIPLRPSKIYK